MPNGTEFVKSNLGTIGAGVGGAALGGIVGYSIGNKKRKKKTKKHRKTSKRTIKRSRRKKRYPHTAGKRRDTSHRRIRFTKRGQPYIILRNGKARFIKMKNVKRSRKMKGGRY